MSVSRNIKTILSLDGEAKYREAIKAVNKEQSLLRSELKNTAAQLELNGDKQGKLKAQSESLAKQIEFQRKKIDEAKAAVEKSTERYGENSETTKTLKIDVNNFEAALAKMEKQLQGVNKEIALNDSKLKQVGEQAQETGKKFSETGEKLSKFGGKMSMYVTAPLLAAAGYSAKAAIDFESAFAGVIKTVDATESELADLRTGIRDMAKELPASAKDISAVAEAAGQLGIQNDSILRFSRAMIDLGEATNLSANDAASSLAQFANITQMSQKDFDRLGSTIVALGNNSATTEADIVSMAMRLAGAGKQVGMTESQIMGISAALASVGIESEAGGSAFSKVIVDMQLAVSKGGESLEDFAKVAGMSSKEFSKKFKDDAAGALTAFVSGLGKMEKTGGDAIGTLDEMGITEVRMRDALLRSAGAGDTLTKSIDLASDAWKENNALTKEAEQRYGTTESKMKIAKNRIDDSAITIGEHLLPVLADMVDWLAKGAEAFGKMSPAMQKTTIIALGVVASIGPVTKTVGTLTKAYGDASQMIGKYLEKLAAKKAAEAVAKGSTEGLTASIGSSGGLMATLGPAAAVIGGVVTALILLGKAAEVVPKPVKDMNDRIAGTADGMKEFRDGIDSAKSALDGFDESAVWATNNQDKLKAKVDEAQAGISAITKKAVDGRRAMTQAEYDRLKELIEQLGAFADGQIEAYQQKNRILEAMAKNEQNMTEKRAQEIIKGAEETRDEIITIAESQRIKEYQVADEIRQNAAKLREKGRNDLAAIEEARASDIEKAANSDFQKAVDAERKKTAGVISAVQDRYLEQHKEEADALKKADEIAKKIAEVEEWSAAEQKKIRENNLIDGRTKAGAIQRIYDEEVRKKKELSAELAKYWDDDVQKVASATAQMAIDIELNGGKQSKEAKKATDGILAAFDVLPKKLRETFANAMQTTIDTIKGKAGELWDKAAEIGGGFVQSIKDKLGIKSPSRVMREIAENVTGTFTDTVDAKSSSVEASGKRMTDKFLSEAARAQEVDLSVAMRGRYSLENQRRTIEQTHIAQAPSVVASQSGKWGDITIPIYVDGKLQGVRKITSEELAKQDKLRTLAVGEP